MPPARNIAGEQTHNRARGGGGRLLGTRGAALWETPTPAPRLVWRVKGSKPARPGPGWRGEERGGGPGRRRANPSFPRGPKWPRARAMPRGGGSSERARPGLGRSSRAGRGVAPGGRPAAPRAPALSPAHLHGFLEHRHPGGSGPRSASAPQAPRSGSGPASPGSFKLTSDRYRGLGGGRRQAERGPKTPERNTEMPEARGAADGKARRRPGMPDSGRKDPKRLGAGGRGSPPEVVEDGRRLPSRGSARRLPEKPDGGRKGPKRFGRWVGVARNRKSLRTAGDSRAVGARGASGSAGSLASACARAPTRRRRHALEPARWRVRMRAER